MPRERDVQEGIVRKIKAAGGKVYKFHGSAFGYAGAPDLMGAVMGVPVALEVKTVDGRVTPKQAHELQEWKKQGFAAGVVRSWEDVLSLVYARKSEMEEETNDG
jgi:hypothetical protein